MTFSEAPAQLSLAKIIAGLFAMPAAAKQGIPRSFSGILSRLLETRDEAITWHETCRDSLAGSLEICHSANRTGSLSNSLGDAGMAPTRRTLPGKRAGQE
jgi:hypothetical protein